MAEKQAGNTNQLWLVLGAEHLGAEDMGVWFFLLFVETVEVAALREGLAWGDTLKAGRVRPGNGRGGIRARPFWD